MLGIYKLSIWGVLPYIFVLFILYVWSTKKDQKKALTYSFILVFIFSSIRYGIGYDYYTYYFDVVNNLEHKEFLSTLFVRISYYFNVPQLFFVINSFIALYPIYYVAKNENLLYSQLIFFIYFLSPDYFLESLGIVRNASAYSLVFLSSYFLLHGKNLKYIICVILAGLIHTSGWIGLSLIVFKYLHLNKKLSFILFVLSFFLGEVFQTYLSQIFAGGSSLIAMKIVGYIENPREGGGLIKYVIIALNLLLFVYWDKLVSLDKKNLIYLNITNVGTCLRLALAFDHTLALRISCYFMLFQILLFPSLILVNQYFNRLAMKKILTCFFVVYFVSGLMVPMISYDGRNRMNAIPYQTIFNKKDYSNYVIY